MKMKFKIFFSIFALVLIAINVVAYMNMVVRMGLPAGVDIFKGPTVVAFFISIGLTFIVGHFTQKVKQMENDRHIELEEVQREIIYRMGDIAETRSAETGQHVKRVSEFSKYLGMLYGLEKKEYELLANASPMHDIGKVAIPDRVLLKPGRLTIEEFEEMKEHARLGYEILKESGKTIFDAAATIALEHHEKWDGSGYPKGLEGENIHIFGRITAVTDVFDALASKRVYKDAWDDDKIRELFIKERGKHFDPTLVDLLIEHFDDFLQIRSTYSDHQ
jgi:response regulator RpfG family c-di-GMP phosphodiesterase